MDKQRYPKCWSAILLRKANANAFLVKLSANWHCERCGRPCQRPGEDFESLKRRLLGTPWEAETDKPGRFILTTAHLDQRPENNDRANLMALCPTCHNRHDISHRVRNRITNKRRRLEALGQLSFMEDLSA